MILQLAKALSYIYIVTGILCRSTGCVDYIFICVHVRTSLPVG